MPELLQELDALSAGPVSANDTEYPFVLMAGERRDYSANTIYRDPDWRRKDAEGALRINPDDAQRLGLEKGAHARISTRAGKVTATVEITERMLPGHVSLPNGYGLANEDGQQTGVAPNELTSAENRDKFAGTPHHKHVPANIEAVA